MNVPVIFFDGNPGVANPDKLDELIDRRVIVQFFRSNEWINATKCQHRGLGGIYYGPERRRMMLEYSI
jgi:hypothetical protein